MTPTSIKAILFDKDGTLAKYKIASNSNIMLAPCSKNLAHLFASLTSHNIKIGIASRDSLANILKLISHFQLEKFVSFSAGIDSGFNEKPHPEVALAFLKKINSKPETACIIGDSPEDLIMGARANFKHKIAVLNGYHHKSQLAHLASIVMPSIDSLIKNSKPTI